MTITIAAQSEFFIALCKVDAHSYITVGVKNADDIHVLTALGKTCSDAGSECGVPFWDTVAVVKNEKFMFNKNLQKKTVAYKAYAISYQHYLEFLHYLRLLSLSQKSTHIASLNAFCPDPKHPFKLEWKAVEAFEAHETTYYATDLSNHRRLGLFNTCRHSAIGLTKQATQCTNLGSGVSTLFFKDLPLRGVFSDGRLAQTSPHFYILPLPPASFESISPHKLKIITQLYRRLDDIILSEQKHPITIQKFDKIKQLYNNLTRDSQLSMFDMMKGIEAWEVDNKALISTHRKHHWITFQTATQKMLSNLHHEFAALRNVAALGQQGSLV